MFSGSNMEIDSTEYQCWHEAGHAVVCLHMKGIVEFIELIEKGRHKGLARTRCITLPEIDPYVACGGFAAEFVLSRDGYLEPHDNNEFSKTVFKNSTKDRDAYFNVNKEYKFSKEENTEFMNHAIDQVAPIIRKYASAIPLIVSELLETKIITGKRIKKLLNGT